MFGIKLKQALTLTQATVSIREFTVLLTAESLSPPLEHDSLVGAHPRILGGGTTTHVEALFQGIVGVEAAAHVDHTQLGVGLGALIPGTLMEDHCWVLQEGAQVGGLHDLCG